MIEQEQREAVVREAMGWLGTPYHHHGEVRGAGVDCAHLLIAAYVGAGVVPPVEPGFYPQDWHLHRSEELFVGWLSKTGARRVQTPALGDVMVFRFGRCFSHGGIWAGDCIVHSYLGLGVCGHRLTEAPLHGREFQVWSMWGEA
jgi:cell wall-associated NlpC family hydrolase